MKTKSQSAAKTTNGPAKEYFGDGKLSSVGAYLDGKKTGFWKYYLRNGLLKAAGKYVAGQLDGPWKWNRENGKPLQAGKFKNGKQEGLWKRCRWCVRRSEAEADTPTGDDPCDRFNPCNFILCS
jgi:antitoxin component YwqK of YwqJK toxin-antitoxin module